LKGEGGLADFAHGAIAVVDPLQEALLVDELGRAVARTGTCQGALGDLFKADAAGVHGLLRVVCGLLLVVACCCLLLLVVAYWYASNLAIYVPPLGRKERTVYSY
jgi:hypothetical protein